MPDFTEILSKPAEEVQKPKPRPSGTYQGAIAGMPEQRTVNTKDGEKAVIAFKVKMVGARDDVDQDALSEQDDISSWPPMSHDIWVDNEQGVYNLTKFLSEVLGIDKSGKTLGQMCAEAPGKQALFTVAHEPYTSKDGQPEIGVRIRGTAAL